MARQVAKNELFEKPGERAVTEPLSESPWPPPPGDGPDGGAEPLAGDESNTPAQVAAVAGPRCNFVDVDAIEAALRPSGKPMIVHHWATWCAPCDEDLPRIEALAQQLVGRADLLGVSWERFEAADADGGLGAVQSAIRERGLSWPTVVFDGAPDELFSVMELEYQKIPQTRIYDAHGNRLQDFNGPLTEADLPRIQQLVGG